MSAAEDAELERQMLMDRADATARPNPSQIGLEERYEVTRLTPSSRGIVHEGCEYFVLDLTHDPIARMAARVYAVRAGAMGYTKLSLELRAKVRDLTERAIHRNDPREP